MTEEKEENYLNKKLVCVLFPGIVKNDDQALECLGGIRKISQIYSVSSKERLGLSFRPQNPHTKKIFADTKKTSGLLLKVKIRKTVTDNRVNKEVISTSVVGSVNNIYTFNSLSDFQYLPLTDCRPPKCLLDTVFPSGLDTFEDFLQSSAPPFIVPGSFTRADKPLCYSYTDKKDDTNFATEDSENTHYKVRANRKRPHIQYTFSLDEDFPIEPNAYFMERIDKGLPKIKEGYEVVKKLFEERPIWSKNVLRFRTKIRDVDLKIILPSLSYSFKNGPFKLFWVKYGYDPRKEPGSRVYQCLDFRLRHDAGLNSLVAKHESIVYNRKVSRIKKQLQDNSSSEEKINEAAVVYRPGMVPSQRQIYYQFCDIHLDEVQELVQAEPVPGTEIHLARGWLAPGVAEQCREYVTNYAKAALRAEPNQTATPDNYEQSFSSSEEDSIDVPEPQPSTSFKNNE